MSHPATSTSSLQLGAVGIMDANSNSGNQLVDLANELVLTVLEENDLTCSDLAAFAATSRRFYKIATPVLYRKHITEENETASKYKALNPRHRQPVPSCSPSTDEGDRPRTNPTTLPRSPVGRPRAAHHHSD